MKSTWIWIILFLLAIWFFGNDNENQLKKNKNISAYSQNSYFPLNTYTDSVRTFNNYPCTIDCSGHEAGYEWAEENSITDPDECEGKSDSFIEGCQSYAEEQQLNE